MKSFQFVSHVLIIGIAAPFLLSFLYFKPFDFPFSPTQPLNIVVESEREAAILAFLATLVYSPLNLFLGALSALISLSLLEGTSYPRPFIFALAFFTVLATAVFWGVTLDGSKWILHWLVAGAIVSMLTGLMIDLVWR